MQIIPVLDLKDGAVVHARGGDRAAYRPLWRDRASDPVSVVSALLALHPFRTFYVADLDAIERRGDNLAAARALRRRFPALELWIDAGIADAAALAEFCALDAGLPVVGSETLTDRDLLAGAQAREFILSLDFRGDAFLGPDGLSDSPALWPDRLIVMTLDRVGSGRGPDLERLRALRAAAPGKRFYAAGGVRDQQDLERLARVGAAGALMASALHANVLSPAALAAYG